MPSLIQTHCDQEDCPRPHYALGYCRGHYKRLRAGLDLAPAFKGRRIYALDEKCIYPACAKPPRRLDLCLDHMYIRNVMKVSDEKILELFSGTPVCWICGRPEWGSTKKHLSLDHDHSHHPDNRKMGCDDCIRGLLCHGCNVGIGNLMDSPELLRKAIEYLENHSLPVSSEA